MMRSGVAIPAAVARMTAANNPAALNFKMGKPVFRAVDAAAGAKHEFEKSFHRVFQANVMPAEQAQFVAEKSR
jgi:hypothetical protein